MKIGILTQPLHNNYGGLLQAYALQRVLKEMGHEPWIIRRENNIAGCYWWLRINLGNVVRFILRRPLTTWVSRSFIESIRVETSKFIDKKIIPKTGKIYTTRALKHLILKDSFAGIVVGSDQVWRPVYSPCLSNFFLDFLGKQSTLKRIAYAASFGTDKWEFSNGKTSQCSKLLKRFDAVSVREDSAVALCKEWLGVDNAKHVLDPTLLHEKEVYCLLIDSEKEEKSKGNLFCYILDKNEQKKSFIQQVEMQLKLTAFEVMPKAHVTTKDAQKEDLVFPRVTQWLRAFMDAEYVVTDSFHGCVFSIIFNRPFLAIGNAGRGQARFLSLLRIFGLEDRLISSLDNITQEQMMQPVNWEQVNEIKKEWQTRSINFLKAALSK